MENPATVSKLSFFSYNKAFNELFSKLLLYNPKELKFFQNRAILKVITLPFSLQAEVSHNEAKMRGRRETSADLQHVSYQTCPDVP